MTRYFYKTTEMNSSSYAKIPSRNSANLKIQNDDENFFLWSSLYCLHPCNKNHPNRVSKNRQHFKGINNRRFHFSDDLENIDVHRFEKMKTLSKKTLI